MWTEKKLARLADGLLRALRINKGNTLDVFLLPNRTIAAFKARFIKEKGEPNVLSFPEPADFPHPETKKRYLGEVYLNGDILKKSPERAAPLLLHGMLHLLGYGHGTPTSRKRMESAEKRILRRLR